MDKIQGCFLKIWTKYKVRNRIGTEWSLARHLFFDFLVNLPYKFKGNLSICKEAVGFGAGK